MNNLTSESIFLGAAGDDEEEKTGTTEETEEEREVLEGMEIQGNGGGQYHVMVRNGERVARKKYRREIQSNSGERE